jgi:hypothetical protein
MSKRAEELADSILPADNTMAEEYQAAIILIDDFGRKEREACAERAIAFYDLGFSPGQADELRATILEAPDDPAAPEPPAAEEKA